MTVLDLNQLVNQIADLLKEFDSTRPVDNPKYLPGIGPFTETHVVKEIAKGLSAKGISSKTMRTPDMSVGKEWAIEFKIVRPFNDNGSIAENWSVNLLHPYPGNVSSLGDCLKLQSLAGYTHKAVIVIGYEHDPPKISIDPLIKSFELLASQIMSIHLSDRAEQMRTSLVHPVFQIVHVIGWEILS